MTKRYIITSRESFVPPHRMSEFEQSLIDVYPTPTNGRRIVIQKPRISQEQLLRLINCSLGNSRFPDGTLDRAVQQARGYPE